MENMVGRAKSSTGLLYLWHSMRIHPTHTLSMSASIWPLCAHTCTNTHIHRHNHTHNCRQKKIVEMKQKIPPNENSTAPISALEANVWVVSWEWYNKTSWTIKTNDFLTLFSSPFQTSFMKNFNMHFSFAPKFTDNPLMLYTELPKFH